MSDVKQYGGWISGSPLSLGVFLCILGLITGSDSLGEGWTRKTTLLN